MGHINPDELVPLSDVTDDHGRLNLEILKLSDDIRVTRGSVSLVQFHQQRLGKQSNCVTIRFDGGARSGGNRYWIWDFSTFRVFVNNEFGFHIELILNDNTTREAVWESLKEYRKSFGCLVVSLEMRKFLSQHALGGCQ